MTAAILWSAFWLYGKLFLHLEVLDILVAMLRLVQLMLFQKILIATLEFEVAASSCIICLSVLYYHWIENSSKNSFSFNSLFQIDIFCIGIIEIIQNQIKIFK